ncbi:hypothetical protein COU17_02025 [Candidatus Kaiserbacteria bacterium CG10_big_fil_rev_8_21_14_0_10_49_17]|uniref:Uncharacterized protein n=1 Tax=Candidatus Kaiserbacteria bacterium CG10_big_fil_rev_8_21_14_0_10_49_17 TaxID=1974609 RepID=A0A2M6WEB0_9BACT|nr:MAG: hypothetical protein COU17_02025 [Candidatus Kaiserbacteria bacterium CG10_big_fil_rev_8_21_14_0_10_49_17]
MYFRHKCIALLLVVSIIMPYSFLAVPQKTEAAAGLFGCASAAGIGAGLSVAISTLAVPVNDALNNINQNARTSKECILDGVVAVLREALIAALVRSVVNWINSGFEGNPAFITDFQQFLTNIADEIIGEFIYGSDLAFLCSPFQLKVRVSLGLSYTQRYSPPKCTLSQVVGNVQNFIQGNFLNGGWLAFNQLHSQTGNNPVLGLISADFELQGRIRDAQFTKTKAIDWGQGFKPFEICKDSNPGVATVPGGVKRAQKCETATPGQFINHQLNRTVSSSIGQLELADEIDEIIGALFRQLVSKLLTGAGGLLGASRSSSSSGSYLTQLYQSSEARAQESVTDVANNALDTVLARENAFQSAKKTSLTRLALSESLLIDLRACYAGKLGSLSAADEATAESRMEQASSTVASNIKPLMTTIAREIAESETTIEKLIAIKVKIGDAETRTEVETIIEEELDPLLSSPAVHSPEVVGSAQQQKDDVNSLMGTLDAQTNSKISECNAFPPPPTTP